METPPFTDTTPPERTNTFPAQLRFWGIHCGLTALPSFLIALTTFNGLLATLAMLAGIGTFVFGYAYITSTPLYGKIHAGLIGRSIKLGTRIRMIISLLSLPLLIPLIGHNLGDSVNPPESLLLVPDFWFGCASLIITGLVLSVVTQGDYMGGFRSEQLGEHFVFPYLATVVEGLLISFSLIIIAFITLIILNARKNRQLPPAQHYQNAPPL